MNTIKNHKDYNLHHLYVTVQSILTDEERFRFFAAGLEPDEVPILTAKHSPTASTLRARSIATPCWDDPSWSCYALLLFRDGRPFRYDGIATALRTKQKKVGIVKGGGAARAKGHLRAVSSSTRFFYRAARKFKGRVAIYSNWRVAVCAVPQKKSAFLMALRALIQYNVEVSVQTLVYGCDGADF